ncbi:uncharacterized protein NECHADRAFT_79444 [Fusarium vanettenii 77-13-4]|uniref:Uncharacterized protein n=1 Tax=Fusarium vanettenii (strain ATCC MYA-4622 / CBS 123669 / FGSC 9596 / NRRL 45880 / 77-13-4) TaxID=660122 RepID=C7YNW1_FUSV7|nr:uncharacterized protein NECHADRAFT_79444 [Fusarium vanettenii 77-13-4]EEU46645.1 predicted protein [Fusarium vanettenii 77-13-4]
MLTDFSSSVRCFCPEFGQNQVMQQLWWRAEWRSPYPRKPMHASGMTKVTLLRTANMEERPYFQASGWFGTRDMSQTKTRHTRRNRAGGISNGHSGNTLLFCSAMDRKHGLVSLAI